ncbi:11926_t:CDS:2 [Acaulospora colombiana]|uniref:11926_t:CDS:1 n=1 Tax=Acaulospora colombiana TaxID=27376 RepID=A0ACA9L9S0_9GLOM|nr:11926_t:CDS:2 [Acaulospora colombiana]
MPCNIKKLSPKICNPIHLLKSLDLMNMAYAPNAKNSIHPMDGVEPATPFENIVKIGEGGFSTVYRATWIDGSRTLGWDGNFYEKNVPTRTKPITVVLKTLSKLMSTSPNFLQENLKWENKLTILYTLSKSLYLIHDSGYTHGDFHSGNILQKSDQSDDEIISPPSAPNVSEIQCGPRDRPKFADGTPECYMNLAKQCMDDDPSKRPRIKRVQAIIFNWKIIIQGLQALQAHISNDKLKVKEEFEIADKMVPSLITTSQKHPQAVYVSKRLCLLDKDEIQIKSSNATGKA